MPGAKDIDLRTFWIEEKVSCEVGYEAVGENCGESSGLNIFHEELLCHNSFFHTANLHSIVRRWFCPHAHRHQCNNNIIITIIMLYFRPICPI